MYRGIGTLHGKTDRDGCGFLLVPVVELVVHTIDYEQAYISVR